MKKLYCSVVLAGICLSVTPAFALFTNGGFEDGDFTGWNLTGSGASLSAVIGAGSMQDGQTLAVNPYQGLKMARINDSYGDYDWTTISQSDDITQADLDAGGTLYVQWGAMLIEPTNGVPHDADEQPYFSVKVLKNGFELNQFSADASQTDGWQVAGTNPPWDSEGDMWYKTGVWSYNFSGFAVGDILTIEMHVEDCGLGGHGGFAFLDGIGVTRPPEVPEPTTMLLFGTGLAGLAAVGRRREKK